MVIPAGLAAGDGSHPHPVSRLDQRPAGDWPKGLTRSAAEPHIGPNILHSRFAPVPARTVGQNRRP